MTHRQAKKNSKSKAGKRRLRGRLGARKNSKAVKDRLKGSQR